MASGSQAVPQADRRAALLKKWVPVPSDPAKAATPCPICKEHFQSEFAEDEEEWIWRNAVQAEGQVCGSRQRLSEKHRFDLTPWQIFHATCRADAMSSAVANKLLATDSTKPAPSARALSPARTSRAGTPQAGGAGAGGQAIASPLNNASTADEAAAVVVKEEPPDQAPNDTVASAADTQSLKRKAEESLPSLDVEKEVKKERLDPADAET